MTNFATFIDTANGKAPVGRARDLLEALPR
jgi:hypothetical protein